MGRLSHPSTLGHWECLETAAHCGVTARTLRFSNLPQAFSDALESTGGTAWRDSARSRKKDEVVTQFSAVLSP